jgi:hypothetical protein
VASEWKSPRPSRREWRGSLVSIAETNFSSACSLALKPQLRKEGALAYLISISSNIVASFIYSILLIIIFIVAQDQIGGWLASLKKAEASHEAPAKPSVP